MLIAIGMAFLLSLYIVFIYRVTYAGVSFTKTFAGCLIMIAMVTALVIQVITSNVVLSLGMVGALSIVRFRTAVKEASDTAFLFWAIATGIICGAGYVAIAILSTLLLGLLFALVYAFSKKGKSGRYMVVVRYSAEAELEATLKKMPGYVMKNKTLRAGTTELVAEIRLGDAQMQQLNKLQGKEGVQEISIMHSVSGSVL